MALPTPTPMAKQIQRDGRLLRWLMTPFCRLNLPHDVAARTDRPTILFANHRSLLDVFCAAAFCSAANTSCRVFVQATFFKNPIMGRWLRRIGAIPLNRDAREEAFAEARELLARHELLGVMPEGRLVPPSEWNPQVGPGRPGVAELAHETGSWMRVIAFHNTDLVWPRGGWPRLARHRPTVTLHLDHEHYEPSGDAQADVDQMMARLTEVLDELDRTIGRG